MHKYQPRIHVVKANDESSLSIQEGDDGLSTHVFKETQFMAVTAYQNQQVLIPFTVLLSFVCFLVIYQHCFIYPSSINF